MTRILIITSWLLASTALCVAQSEQPSLADVARQNKKGKKAAIVLNDDNLRRSANTLASSTPSKSAKENVSASAETKKAGNDQTAGNHGLSGDLADLERKAASYKAQQEGWNRSAQRYQELLTNETNEFRRQMYQDALSNDQKNAATFAQKAQQAEVDLAKAREAASKAPAGQTTEAKSPDNNDGH
ncbi:MAG TPA: hypothetical protein VFL42_04980 [Terriglobales bacterium]|nr:hypothetical protein [Terriglobales bacterium]